MAELALADRMRVSHSHLKGGPASWTPADVEKALEFRAYQAGVCSGCGTHHEVWEGGALPLEPYDYRCTGCEQLEGFRHALTKDLPPEQLFGARFGLRWPETEEVLAGD